MNSKRNLQFFSRQMSCNLFWIIAVISHVSLELVRAQNTCNSSRACFPEIVDLLHNLGSFPDRSVTATSSCNESSLSGGQYNSLVPSDTTVYTCASASVQPSNMVDQENGAAPTYWQSENMIDSEGAEPKIQYLVFNFTDQFLIHTILIKFTALHVQDDQTSQDARPVAWSIEKWNVTLDAWATLRYFALDCEASFPGVAIYDPFSTSLEYRILFCEQYNPVVAGEPFFDTDNFIEFYPGILDTHDNLYKDNPEATEIFSTSAIRFVIQSPPSARPLKSYVAISDVIIDGQCKCYGHSAVCGGQNEATCECEHNTQGSECRSCLPLYNNDQWKPGTSTAANICVECACNDHASSCVYDEVKASGVCTDCVNNTAGDTCSSCVSGFYINPGQSAAAAGAGDAGVVGVGVGVGVGVDNSSASGVAGQYCLACACDARGTEAASLTACNATSGQCMCKERVTGRECAECIDTNWGLAEDKPLGCDVCDCVAGGSASGTNMCDKVTGECSCKVNVGGVRCDTCKDFTFNFDPANPDGCTACDCDPGASLDATCDVTSGACSCLPNIGGRDCRTPTSGFFVPKMDITVLEPEEFVTEGVTLRPGHGTVGATVSGRGFVTLAQGTPLQMTFESVYSGRLDVVLRLERISTEDLFVFVQGTITLSSADNSCNGETIPSGQVWDMSYSNQLTEIRGGVVIGQICASSGASYVVNLVNPAGSPVMVDSVVFIPDLTSVTAELSPRLPADNITSCRDATVMDVRANRQSCAGVEYSVMSALLGGARACTCVSGALTGSGCDDHSGDCLCRPGVLGPQCLRCELDSYGFSEQSGCQACGCEVTGSSSVSCSDAGVCQCLVNVVGDKCDACVADHYGLSTGEGCRPCECNLNYSTSNSCDDAGMCPCQPGVGGQLCDQCLDGHYALSTQGCTECACNTFGSTGRSCDVMNGTCQCLPRVEGNRCSECKPGFYALGEWHPSGCLECFCWGQGQTCSSAPTWYDAPTQITWLTEQEALTNILVARDDQGVEVTVDTPTVATPTGQQYAMSVQAAVTSSPSRDIFFIAPQSFLGDRTPSFGRHLSLVARAVPLPDGADGGGGAGAGAGAGVSDSAGSGDVILRGGYSNLNLGFQFSQNFTDNEITTIQVPIIQDSWRILRQAPAVEGSNATAGVTFTSLTAPTHSQLMEVLTRVTALDIRAYRSDGLRPVLDLVSIQLDGAIDGGVTLVHSEVLVNNVGQCACAQGYTGRLCETCAPGWTRADPSTPDPNTECVTCACNGHGVMVNQCDDVTGVCTRMSGPCDPETGVCACQHNTGGDHCEMCLPGYYGDATRGTSEDCLQCACPGIVVLNEVNVFAQTCSLNGTGTMVCADCVTGHEGDRCERCVQGYFGTPENATNNNGSCSLCACNGRADTCDPRTGVCDACRNNTAGDNCQLCATNYFGDPQVAPCQECTCTLPGSTGSCDHRTGQCECLPNVVQSSSCDTCIDTTFNLVAGQGCEPCSCHTNGSTSAICDKVSGQCPCRQVVQGRRCDECTANFWNINTATGCDPCQCNAEGTIKDNDVVVETCDVNTGQCTCALPGIVGRTCDRCSPVSKLVLQLVNLIFLGEFPNCQVCGQCFDDWALVLEDVGKDFQESRGVLDNVWNKYERRAASEVTPLLDTVEQKITETSASISTFQVVATQLSELQAQFLQASTRHSAASARVGILSDTEKTLAVSVDTLAALTDQIQVTVTAVSSVASIQAELDDLAREAQATAVAGNTTWEEIQTLSFVGVSPEDREREFRQQAQRYTQIASLANNSFALITSIYESTLAPGVAENEQELQTASDTASGAMTSLAEVSQILENITRDMTNIQTSLTSMLESSQTAKARLLEAVNSLQDHVINASSALRTAEQVTSAALSFKAAAETEETSIMQSMTSVLENIAALTQAQSDLVQSQVMASRVAALSLPSQADMQGVVDDIAASGVSAEDVSELNLQSQADLYVAEEAISDTSTALRLSKELTEDVQLMQGDIDQSRDLRRQAEEQRVAADGLNENIMAALDQASSQSSQTDSNVASITERANGLLAIVSNATSCFRDQEVEVETAVTSARQAETRAESASEAQRNLLATMNSINSEADEGDLVEALTTMTQADNVMQESTEDLEALVAAAKIEELIQQLLNQNQELRNLDLEVDQLTSELDTIALALQESAVTATCNESPTPST